MRTLRLIVALAMALSTVLVPAVPGHASDESNEPSVIVADRVDIGYHTSDCGPDGDPDPWAYTDWARPWGGLEPVSMVIGAFGNVANVDGTPLQGAAMYMCFEPGMLGACVEPVRTGGTGRVQRSDSTWRLSDLTMALTHEAGKGGGTLSVVGRYERAPGEAVEGPPSGEFVFTSSWMGALLYCPAGLPGAGAALMVPHAGNGEYDSCANDYSPVSLLHQSVGPARVDVMAGLSFPGSAVCARVQHGGMDVVNAGTPVPPSGGGGPLPVPDVPVQVQTNTEPGDAPGSPCPVNVFDNMDSNPLVPRLQIRSSQPTADPYVLCIGANDGSGARYHRIVVHS